MKLTSSRCCICHEQATNNHHEPPKGQVGDHDDTIKLCGAGNMDGCHGLAHHNGGTLTIHKPDVEGEPWHFVCDKKAADLITRRRKRHSLPRVQAGFMYRVIPVEECEGLDEIPDDSEPVHDASAEHDLAIAYAEVAAADSTVFRCKAERFAVARDHFRATYPDWEPRFRDWRRELRDREGKPIPVTDVQASRMLTVADHLPDSVARDLPATRQLLLARALREKRGSVDELASAASSLTARAFAEEYLDADPYEPPTLTCPDCGREGKAADFRRKDGD